MVRIGLVRVLTIEDDEELLDSHGRLLREFINDPELSVISRCIEGHPEGLADLKSEALASPKIVRLGQQMEREDGAAAILVSCVADPGVAELREVVRIPVIGAGSAAAAAAWAMGRPVGALSIEDRILPAIAQGLGQRLVAWEVPQGVKTTVDLMSGEGRQRFVKAGERLKEQGAEAILLACTGFSTINIAPYLQEKLGLQVLDPVIASGLIAYYAAAGNRWMS
jgi:Asp/Glu/hydantoin racemase